MENPAKPICVQEKISVDAINTMLEDAAQGEFTT